MALNLDPAVLDFIRRKQGLPAEPKLGLEFDWGGDPADPVEAPVVPPPAQPKAAPFADENKAVAELEAIDAERNRSNALGYLGQTFSRAGSMVRGDKVGPLPAPPQVDDSVRKFILTRKLGAGAKAGEAPVTDAEVAALVSKSKMDPAQAQALRADPGNFRKVAASYFEFHKDAAPGLEQSGEYVRRGAALKSPVLPTQGEKPAEFAKRVEEQERLEGKGSKELNEAQRKHVMDLPKEFNGLPEVEKFTVASTLKKKVDEASPNGVGDIGLVYAYMTILDPGSSVKEGEVRMAADASPAARRAGNVLQKLLNGDALDQTTRDQFKAEAVKLYEAQREEYQNAVDHYTEIAHSLGIKPELVIRKRGLPKPAEPPKRPGAEFLPKR